MDEVTARGSSVPGRPILPINANSDTREALDDPRALTILTTEHLSLISARSLVYNETFARGGMFLTFLSASLVALGLVSASTGFSRDFVVVATAVLGLDLFIGLATMFRVGAANAEAMRYLQGMNRLRHAYDDAVPGLEVYFVTGRNDDLQAVSPQLTTRDIVPYHFATMPGMLGAICAAVAAAISALLALLWTNSASGAAVAGFAGFALVLVGSAMLMGRWIRGVTSSFDARFPGSTNPEDTNGR
jgi:hypothetical protein